MKKSYAIAFLTFIISSVFAQNTWLNRNDFPSSGRWASASFEINGKGYNIGGRTSTFPLTYVNEVWQYNPGSDSWIQKSAFPFVIVLPSFFSINGKGYVVGGSQSSTYVNSNYQYDPVADTWTLKTAFPENGVGETFQFVINGQAYVGAGARNASQPSATMYAYNPTADSWSSKAAYPGPPTINAIGFSIDSFGYAGLGTDGGGAIAYSQIYKYDVAHDSWTAVAPFPGKARWAPMVFVLNGIAYVGGGATYIASQQYSLNDFYAYDPTSNSWTPVPGIPGAPRAAAGFFTINNSGYIIGGFDNDGDTYIKAVNEFGSCSQLAGFEPIPGNDNNKVRFQIYPNPTAEAIKVKINGDMASSIEYSIMSIDGKVIKAGATKENMFEFGTQQMANGIYVLSITDNNGSQGVQRFEVSR